MGEGSPPADQSQMVFNVDRGADGKEFLQVNNIQFLVFPPIILFVIRLRINSRLALCSFRRVSRGIQSSYRQRLTPVISIVDQTDIDVVPEAAGIAGEGTTAEFNAACKDELIETR